MKFDDVKSGTVVIHHKGNIYTILGILNANGPGDDKFPYLVHYIGSNGLQWARPLKDFMSKFTVKYDGTIKESI